MLYSRQRDNNPVLEFKKNIWTLFSFSAENAENKFLFFLVEHR